MKTFFNCSRGTRESYYCKTNVHPKEKDHNKYSFHSLICHQLYHKLSFCKKFVWKLAEMQTNIAFIFYTCQHQKALAESVRNGMWLEHLLKRCALCLYTKVRRRTFCFSLNATHELHR
jgi:hypothetical protein